MIAVAKLEFFTFPFSYYVIEKYMMKTQQQLVIMSACSIIVQNELIITQGKFTSCDGFATCLIAVDTESCVDNLKLIEN